MLRLWRAIVESLIASLAVEAVGPLLISPARWLPNVSNRVPRLQGIGVAYPGPSRSDMGDGYPDDPNSTRNTRVDPASAAGL